MSVGTSLSSAPPPTKSRRWVGPVTLTPSGGHQGRSPCKLASFVGFAGSCLSTKTWALRCYACNESYKSRCISSALRSCLDCSRSSAVSALSSLHSAWKSEAATSKTLPFLRLLFLIHPAVLLHQVRGTHNRHDSTQCTNVVSCACLLLRLLICTFLASKPPSLSTGIQSCLR